jgi:hypothetical protein
MIGYLIDPKLQRLHDVELPDNVNEQLAMMRELIRCVTLGGGRISDCGDQLWCSDNVFEQQRCFAFKLRGGGVNLGPYGGTCIITGSDRSGRSRAPYIPLDLIRSNVVWLGEIVPRIDWIKEQQPGGVIMWRAVVTYSRPQ